MSALDRLLTLLSRSCKYKVHGCRGTARDGRLGRCMASDCPYRQPDPERPAQGLVDWAWADEQSGRGCCRKR